MWVYDWFNGKSEAMLDGDCSGKLEIELSFRLLQNLHFGCVNSPVPLSSQNPLLGDLSV